MSVSSSSSSSQSLVVTYLSEVVQTLGGEGVVVPLPRELGLDVTLGGQGLHGLDDLQVSDLGEIGVGRSVEVLLGNHDSLCGVDEIRRGRRRKRSAGKD